MRTALRPRRRQIVFAVMAAVASCAPTARADWSAPATVSAPHGAIARLHLASGPGGDLLTWTFYDLLPPAFQVFGPAGAADALALPGGSFGPEGRLPSSYASGPLVNLGGGRVAQVLSVPAGVNTSIPEVAVGRVGGAFGAPRRVRASVRSVPGGASLAGDARGDLVLAWITADRHLEHRVVWVSVRPAGGPFSAPRVLSRRAEAERVTTAMGANGDAVVVFAKFHGRMLAAVKRHVDAWGAVKDLGAAAVDTENDVAPSVLPDGRVIVAWYHIQLTEGGSVGPGSIEVAVQPATRDRFRHAQVLASRQRLTGAPSGRSLAPVVVHAAGHRAVLAFLANASPTAQNAVVEAARLNGATFTAPRVVSPTDQQAAGLAAATGPTGVIVTWIREQPAALGPQDTVFAALSDASTGALGPPEQVSPPEGANFGEPAAAAFDTAGNHWLIAWAGRPQTPSQTVVQVSTGL